MRLFAVYLLVMMTCAFAPNGDRMDPPAHYREIYDSAVVCSKAFHKASGYPQYSKVKWFVVPGKDFKCDHGMRCIGYTDSDRITIASDWLHVDWVIRHELVHYVTKRPHWQGDTVLWGKACHATWGWLGTDSTYKP